MMFFLFFFQMVNFRNTDESRTFGSSFSGTEYDVPELHDISPVASSPCLSSVKCLLHPQRLPSWELLERTACRQK